MDTEQLGWWGLGFLMKKRQHAENLSVFMRSVCTERYGYCIQLNKDDGYYTQIKRMWGIYIQLTKEVGLNDLSRSALWAVRILEETEFSTDPMKIIHEPEEGFGILWSFIWGRPCHSLGSEASVSMNQLLQVFSAHLFRTSFKQGNATHTYFKVFIQVYIVYGVCYAPTSYWTVLALLSPISFLCAIRCVYS